MADRLIDLYGDPISEQRSPLNILEEIILDEYQSRRHNTILRNIKQAKLSQPCKRQLYNVGNRQFKIVGFPTFLDCRKTTILNWP